MIDPFDNHQDPFAKLFKFWQVYDVNGSEDETDIYGFGFSRAAAVHAATPRIARMLAEEREQEAFRQPVMRPIPRMTAKQYLESSCVVEELYACVFDGALMHCTKDGVVLGFLPCWDETRSIEVASRFDLH